MKAVIEIDLGNAAFEGAYSVELARILGRLSNELELVHPTELIHPIPLRDVNGNKVGELRIVED